MKPDKHGINTICTHVGEVPDTQFHGGVSPMYMSTSYHFMDVDTKRYPRYFNTPNQEFLAQKISRLEQAEQGMIFSSGMAAISTCLFAFLKSGDHVVVQKDIYGGTRNLIESHFKNYNIDYTFTEDLEITSFKKAITSKTKVIYIETPSNPLLKLVNLKGIAKLAKSKNIISVIDNTFATPIVQTPISHGIDVVLHSATKYFGGHSDICAGAIATSEQHMKTIWEMGICLGGNLSDFTVWMLERSMKTLGVRVKAQQKNALKLARFLEKLPEVKAVYYPGLKSHKDYNLAKQQMKGFGAMLSFEFHDNLSAKQFLKSITLIKPSMSLAGVESTMLLPAETSHALISTEERTSQGISDNLIRFSVGIETAKDLKLDIKQALNKIK